MLPSDLRQAEIQALAALRSALGSNGNGRWVVDLRFEGLRVLPLALRLAGALIDGGQSLVVLCPDAGSTALARRDAPHLAGQISSLSDHRRIQQAPAEPPDSPLRATATQLLLVGPSPADYELVELICSAHPGAVVLLNPTLEDAAVGIGSVARGRRKGFLAQLQTAYALQPFANRALRRAHPSDWELYRLDPDGFRLAAQFAQKPSLEDQTEVLSGESAGGLRQQLQSLGDLLEDLQR